MVKLPVIKEHPVFHDYLSLSDKFFLALTDVSKREINADACCPKKLYKTLNRYGVRGGLLSGNWWKYFVILARDTDCASSQMSHELIEMTKSLNCQDLSVYEWMSIYRLSLRVGLFHLGYILRDLAARNAVRSLAEGVKNIDQKKQAIAAAIEMRQFDIAAKALSELKNVKEEKSYCKKMEWILDLLSGQDIKRQHFNDNDDNEFCDYVSNKSIAVVGPAKTDSIDAKEVDAFDLVVKLNYKETGKDFDSGYNLYDSIRCDITYYNNQHVWYVIGSNKPFIYNHVNWSVFWQKEHKLIMKRNNPKNSCRVLKNFNKEFFPGKFPGNFNMIPHCLFDLLFFGAKKIKIFNADLMLTVLRTHGYFPVGFKSNNKKRMIERYKRICVIQDPVTQYRALNNLWNAKRIQGDSRFKEVMELGCEEYMRQLQGIYGVQGVNLGFR